MTFKRNLF